MGLSFVVHSYLRACSRYFMNDFAIARTLANTYAYACKHARIHTLTHIHTHAHKNTHTHTHTHTHTQTYPYLIWMHMHGTYSTENRAASQV